MVGVKEFVSRKFVYIQEWKASSAAWILVHTSRSHCGCQSTEDVINTHLGIANFFSACKVFSPFIVIFCTEGRLIVLNRRVFLWLSPTVKFDFTHTHTHDGPSGRPVSGVVLRPLACWDCGFESRRGHGCLSGVLCVVKERSMRRADHSSGGVLPTMVSCDVIQKPQKWGGLDPRGAAALQVYIYIKFC